MKLTTACQVYQAQKHWILLKNAIDTYISCYTKISYLKFHEFELDYCSAILTLFTPGSKVPASLQCTRS